MNALELCCAKGCAENLRYLVDELNLVGKEEFLLDGNSDLKNIEQMNFIMLPIL